jgi:hypothetical protein
MLLVTKLNVSLPSFTSTLITVPDNRNRRIFIATITRSDVYQLAAQPAVAQPLITAALITTVAQSEVAQSAVQPAVAQLLATAA